MDYNKHTARYQLSRFFQSEESFKLKLDAKDISILVVIFDFMDSGKTECCYAPIEIISKISRVPRSTILERIPKLIELQIITKKRTQRANNYCIGNIIISTIRLLDSEENPTVRKQPFQSPTAGLPESGHRTPLYNNNYNNNINKTDSQKIKKPTEWKGIAPTANRGSLLLEEFVKKKSKP